MSEALYHPDNPIGQIALGTTLRMRKHSIPACRTLFHSNFNSFRKAKANFLCPRKHPAFSVIFFSRVVFNSSSRTRWVIGNVRSRVAGLSWRGILMIGVLCACSCITRKATLSGLSTCPHCDGLRLKVLHSRVEVLQWCQNQCRVTSSLVWKSKSAAGQAAATLHSMAVLQTYQVELLNELDEGEGITPEAVKELQQATDLALRATKHTARAVGRSMVGMVTVEHHLWLNLTDIKEKDKSFLMDAQISKDGLFGNSVTTVVKKFRAAKQQSAAFHQLILCRTREIGRRQTLAARSRSSSSHHQQGPPGRRAITYGTNS